MNFELLGKKVTCHFMDDPYPVLPGTKGVIQFTDDIGQIHVDWEDGRSIALIPGKDEYTIED